MTEAKLSILKKKLQHPNDWDKSLLYFMDEFVPQKSFWEKSRRAEIPVFTTMIGELCTDVFRKSPVALVGLQVFKMKELGIVHGLCRAEGHDIIFFYVTKMHKGVFGIVTRNGRLKHSTRLTALPPEELGDEAEQLYEDENEWRDN